jgi:hypothetical protein
MRLVRDVVRHPGFQAVLDDAWPTFDREASPEWREMFGRTRGEVFITKVATVALAIALLAIGLTLSSQLVALVTA